LIFNFQTETHSLSILYLLSISLYFSLFSTFLLLSPGEEDEEEEEEEKEQEQEKDSGNASPSARLKSNPEK